MLMQQRINSLPFVSFSQSHGYRLHPQSLNALQRFSLNSECSVLSIVGKAKTGKSYLLNQLVSMLKNEHKCQQYFPVNDGIGSGTKGIRILPINLEGHTIIVMDMEGLGNLTSSSTNEGKLFALTFLLSSVVIYNNVGPLDLQALQGLGVLAQIGKLIENSLTNNSKKRMESPALIVALRDFALSLENMQGNNITSKQYLENALKNQAGTTGAIASKNQVKKILRDIFSNRDCLTLSLPSEELPLHLGSQLREQFKDQMKQLTKVVRQELTIRSKSLNGKELSPKQWLNFAQDLIGIVNCEQKCGNWRLQGLLFQVYRRQQISVKDRFSMIAQTIINKAQLKCRQVLSVIDVLSEMDENQLKEAGQRGLQELQKLENQFEQIYLNSCKQIEEMMRKQEGGELSQYKIDYNNPKIGNIKDFKELYQSKQSKKEQFKQLKNELKNYMNEQISKMKHKRQQKQENGRFALIMEEIALCQTEKQIDEKYINFMKNLKQSGTELDPKTLEANLLRLEVIYLRRKLQCNDRKNSQQSYQSAKKQERTALKDKQNQFQTAEKGKQFGSNNSKLFTFCQKDVSAFSLDPDTAKKSFLVPYLTFSEEQIKIQILKTLIKQDNKGKYYVEYVLQVVLPDKQWTFNRRWKDFNQLHNILSHLFTTTALPQFTPGLIKVEEHFMGKKEEIESRRQRLQEYARNLLSVDQIRNSRIMQKFLKINKEYVPFL